MDSRGSRTEQLLSELEERCRLEEQYFGRAATESRISRRKLLRSTAGSAVVKAVGIGGLLELFANREAIAAGMLIVLEGVTRERIPRSETPHRHTFSAQFQVNSVSPSAIMGSVFGQTQLVISTGSVPEDQHFHVIQMANVSLEQLILSGPEDNTPGGHRHPVSIE